MLGVWIILKLILSYEANLKEVLKDRSIAGDYCGDFSRVASFFAYSPSQLGEKIESLKNAPPLNDKLVEDLLAYNSYMGAGKETISNIEKLKRPGTRVVMTGQQPGVITGPVYTIYKAITAIKQSCHLSRKYGNDFIPLFWNASEDHDFEEVNHLYYWNEGEVLKKLEVPQDRSDIGKCVGTIKVPKGELIKQFKTALSRTEFTDRVFSLLEETLEFSENWGDWFSRIMLRLFAEHGLVLVDSRRKTIRRLSIPFFRESIQDPLKGTEMINRCGDILEERGYIRQLHRPENACSFFLIEEGKRTRVTYENDCYYAKSKKYTKEDLLKRLQARPEEFSACVAIRPIIADSLFHTAVAVAGPGEIGYFAQLKPLYDDLGVWEPVLIPRYSLTLMEEKILRTLDQWGITPLDLKGDVSGFIERETRKTSEVAGEDFWNDLRSRLRKHLTASASKAEQVDQSFKQPFENAQIRIDRKINKLEKKILQKHRQQNKKANQELVNARNYLYPKNHLQERFLNIFYFLNKYGPELIESLIQELPDNSDKHLYITIVKNHFNPALSG